MVSTKGFYRDFSMDLSIGYSIIQYWRIGLDEDNLSNSQMDMDWNDESLPIIDLPLSKVHYDISRSHIFAKK